MAGPVLARTLALVAAVATVTAGCAAPQLPSPRAAAVACVVTPSVLRLDTTHAYDPNNGNNATGLLIGATGEVLTNNHVVLAASEVTATTDDGRQYSATVLGTDLVHDLAVLRLAGASGLRAADLGDSATVAAGQRVYALGNVHGSCGLSTGTVRDVAASTVSGHALGGDSLTLTGLIESDAPLESGVSGGPLVNERAEVVGILAAGYESESGAYRGFAIPINQALAIAHQVLSGTTSATVHIGPAASLGLEAAGAGVLPPTEPATAALVSVVLPGTPAARLGIGPGCRILAVDGRRVTSGRDLLEVLHGREPGDTVALKWRDRNGQSRSASVRLVAGPPL